MLLAQVLVDVSQHVDDILIPAYSHIIFVSEMKRLASRGTGRVCIVLALGAQPN